MAKKRLLKLLKRNMVAFFSFCAFVISLVLLIAEFGWIQYQNSIIVSY